MLVIGEENTIAYYYINNVKSDIFIKVSSSKYGTFKLEIKLATYRYRIGVYWYIVYAQYLIIIQVYP